MGTLHDFDQSDYADWKPEDIVRPAGDYSPEAWRRAWHEGLVPQLSTAGLRGLAQALKRDDTRIIQGSSILPPPVMCNQHEPAEHLCPLCWALLDGGKPFYVSTGPLEDRTAAKGGAA